MIVMKFGGTSVESAEAIERVAQIVASRRDRLPLVVVSAMAKVTDQLVTMGQLAASGESQGKRGDGDGGGESGCDHRGRWYQRVSVLEAHTSRRLVDFGSKVIFRRRLE